MKKHKLFFSLLYSLLLIQCEKGTDSDNKEFNFPEIDNIDMQIYNEIKKTCES